MKSITIIEVRNGYVLRNVTGYPEDEKYVYQGKSSVEVSVMLNQLRLLLERSDVDKEASDSHYPHIDHIELHDIMTGGR